MQGRAAAGTDGHRDEGVGIVCFAAIFLDDGGVVYGCVVEGAEGGVAHTGWQSGLRD